MLVNSRLGMHLTAASSLWTQLCVTAAGQEKRLSSVPMHCRSSKWMGPDPGPKVLIGPEIAVLSVMEETKMKASLILS